VQNRQFIWDPTEDVAI